MLFAKKPHHTYTEITSVCQARTRDLAGTFLLIRENFARWCGKGFQKGTPSRAGEQEIRRTALRTGEFEYEDFLIHACVCWGNGLLNDRSILRSALRADLSSPGSMDSRSCAKPRRQRGSRLSVRKLLEHVRGVSGSGFWTSTLPAATERSQQSFGRSAARWSRSVSRASAPRRPAAAQRRAQARIG